MVFVLFWKLQSRKWSVLDKAIHFVNIVIKMAYVWGRRILVFINNYII